MSAFAKFAFRLSLAFYLFFSAFQTYKDDHHIFERNTNQALVYYNDRFQGIDTFHKNHPSIFGTFDSLITHGTTLLAVTAAMFLLMGNKNLGGLFAIMHALTMIAFSNNTWTPKVDQAFALRNFMMSLTELGAGVAVMFRVMPEMPVMKAKSR